MTQTTQDAQDVGEDIIDLTEIIHRGSVSAAEAVSVPVPDAPSSSATLPLADAAPDAVTSVVPDAAPESAPVQECSPASMDLPIPEYLEHLEGDVLTLRARLEERDRETALLATRLASLENLLDPSGYDGTLENRLAKLESAAADLGVLLKDLTEDMRVHSEVLKEHMTALRGRLAALEEHPDPTTRLEDMEDRLMTLEARPDGEPSESTASLHGPGERPLPLEHPDRGTVQALEARLDALEQRIDAAAAAAAARVIREEIGVLLAASS